MLQLTLLSDPEESKSISAGMFGTNYLTRYYSPAPDGNFAAAMELVGVTNLRYPGGSMTEESFLVTDPDRVVDELGRRLTPLNSFLDLAKTSGSEVTIVIPTRDLLGATLDQHGNRYVNAVKIAEIEDFVETTLSKLKDGSVAVADIIHAFEIGNEYWGSGEMSATEYGRVVDAVAPAIARAIESVLGTSALGEIGILAQMGSPLGEQFGPSGLYGSLTVASDPALLTELGLGLTDFDSNGSLKWLSKVQLSNFDIIEQISDSAKNNITGLVEHFYLTAKVDDLRHSSDMIRYIDKDVKHWVAAGYGDKDFVMTEWNIQADNQEQFGLKGAGALLFQFECMVRMGFSEAYSWPILSGNTTELAGGIKGDPYLTPAGAALQHMAENIEGLNLLELQELGPNLEVSGYGQSDKVVLYISSRDTNTISLSADLSDVTNGLRLTSAQSISVDKSDSDGVHRLKNGVQVDVPYYSENDLNAQVGDLDSGLIFNNQILTTELDPYEVLMLVFERKAIISAVSYTLSVDDFELTLAGSMAIDGTGNQFDNILTGNSAANRLDGGAGDDILSGLGGADTLSGQAGDDVYIIDSLDVVFENSNGGNDTIKADFSYWLQANFENLTLLGGNPISGKGNQLDNVLVGNNAANAISGEGGNDTLSGGAGADTLAGGAGDDTYHVDALDKVNEAKNMGTDTVISAQTYKLGVNLENLTLSGSGNINGTGNLLNNILVGNSGDNVLDGVSGRDTMIGGAGDDTYYTNGLDNMIEAVGEGVDKVFASVSHTLFGNIENLTLTGSSNLNGTGNALDNRMDGNPGKNSIFGGDGADTLDGGLGSDGLSGGLGEDVFVFSTKPGAANVDTILDFDTVDDSIWLSRAVFANLGSGVLDADAFMSNDTGRASDASDRIIYETDTGKLFFDADGSGAMSGVLFAQLVPQLNLTWEDVFVF